MYHGGSPHGVAPEHISKMRSGGNFKFSFASENPLAVQTFGQQAFPTNASQGPNIPRRGPMGPPSPQQTVFNGPPPQPVLGSNTAQAEGGASNVMNGDSPAFKVNQQANGAHDVEMTGTPTRSSFAVTRQSAESPVQGPNGVHHDLADTPPVASPAPAQDEPPQHMSAKAKGKQRVTEASPEEDVVMVDG